MSKSQLSYKSAGVDIDAGDALVDRIKPLARATARPGADSALGGFGAYFDLKAAGYSDPILVNATDGVGTKLKIAIQTGTFGTIGIDLVAMCVNDLAVQGAEPLFFLDYYATGKLHVDTAAQVVAGIAAGCKIAGCALIGGETAEMPGMYQADDFDLAGFAVGALERSQQQADSDDIAEGDIVLGLASSGLHSNGYSLVHKIIERSGLQYSDPAPFVPDQTLGQALLTPTRIYSPAVCTPGQAPPFKALAHITGGGLLENIPRVLPDTLGVVLDAKKWAFPAVFQWLQQQGNVAPAEMARTFNCGIGMAVVVAADKAAQITSDLKAAGETVFEIGHVVATTEFAQRVTIQNLDETWIK